MKMKTETKLGEIAALPMSEWQQALATVPLEHMIAMRDEGEGLVVRLARLTEYVEYVSAKQGHARAVKAQNKRAEKVRKAMGFAYPKADVAF